MLLVLKHALRGNLYWASPFHAELAPSVWARSRGTYYGDLTLGLLASQPDPDGLNSKEIVDQAYKRVPVQLVPYTPTHLTIAHEVSFCLSRDSVAVGLAVWNRHGEIEAYGGLLSQTTRAAPPYVNPSALAPNPGSPR